MAIAHGALRPNDVAICIDPLRCRPTAAGELRPPTAADTLGAIHPPASWVPGRSGAAGGAAVGDGDPSVVDGIIAGVRRHGSLPVEAVVDAALYGDGGFYAAGGAAGRAGGDFLTAPEVGPLFGAVVARALDGWWSSMGEPDPFVVVDAGAGPGTLCRTVLAAGPACARALRYLLVERSAAQRARHGGRLASVDPSPAVDGGDPAVDPAVPAPLSGPTCVSLAALPRVPGPALVIANELLDNLPFGLAERREGTWHEVRVGWDGAAGPARRGGTGRLVERLAPLAPARAAVLDALVPAAAEGTQVPLQEAAERWLRAARAVAGPGGRVLAVDYATTTADMAARPRGTWLRTYRQHARGGPWLDGLGTQDITCEVAIDQLAGVGTPSDDRSQAAWLRAWGIDELVDEARRTWSERAAVADLGALAARSRVAEGAALTDPEGLGGFRVLEWPGA